MSHLFQKHKLLFTIIGGFFILAVIIALASYSQSRAEVSDQDLSTPELIGKAHARGEITEEERLLYLAYAIYEYESLPSRFRGNAGWRGTSTVMELHKAANSPSGLCSMSPHIRSELQRLLKSDTTCD